MPERRLLARSVQALPVGFVSPWVSCGLSVAPGCGLAPCRLFSLGLAIVQVAIGALAFYAKNLLVKSSGSRAGAAFRWLCAASIVIIIELLMIGVSAGILHSRWVAY